jgi:ferredoxin-fold anticodon binding domain-containing protein
MFDSLAKLFEKASTPGDIATVLVFGTAGFLVDAGLNAVGFLEPGVVGVTAASGALGVKKSIEATLALRREREAERKKRIDEEQKREEEGKEKAQKLSEAEMQEWRKRQAEVTRAEQLCTLLENDPKHENLKQRLELEIKLFETRITDIDAFKVSIDEIVNTYRSF